MARKTKTETTVNPGKDELIELIKQRYHELVVKPRRRMAEDFAFEDDHLAEDEYALEEAGFYGMYDLDRI